jgi:hypothetical protein
MELPRPRERALDQPKVANARAAAEPGDLAVVDGEDLVEVQPERLSGLEI